MVNVSTSETKAPCSYPKLMENSNGTIVLLSNSRDGVVIFKGEGDREVGYISKWDTQFFTDYTGTVSLTNEEGE